MTWNGQHDTSTTARGYGTSHQREVRTRTAHTRPTDPCGYCGQPLGPKYQTDQHGRKIKQWHVPHAPDRTYLPGMWHRACNQREAALRARTRQTRARATSTLRW